MENKENEQAVKTTIDIAKNLVTGLEMIKENGNIGIKYVIDDKLEHIADFIAGEFLGLSQLGRMSLMEIFVRFSMEMSQKVKND